MMRTCLLRFVNHYESSQTEYLQDKTSNEIANFLISLNSKIDRIAYHKAKLNNSHRKPNEPLNGAILKIKNICEMIHPYPADADRRLTSPTVNRLLINAIISFVKDDIALPLLSRIKIDNDLSRLHDYTHYLTMAMNAELRSNAYPTVALKYGRKMPHVGSQTLALNSIYIPEIHPCQKVPPKKPYPNRSLEHYFGQYAGPDYSQFPQVHNFEDHFPPPRNDDDHGPFFNANDFENFGIDLEEEVQIQGPNVLPQPQQPQSQPAHVVHPGLIQNKENQQVPVEPVQKTISEDRVPPYLTVFQSNSGKYVTMNNDRYYITKPVQSTSQSKSKIPTLSSLVKELGAKAKSKVEKKSVSSTTAEVGSSSESEDKEKLYAELLTMIVDLQKPVKKTVERSDSQTRPTNQAYVRNKCQDRDKSKERQPYQNRNRSSDRYRRDRSQERQSYTEKNRSYNRDRSLDRQNKPSSESYNRYPSGDRQRTNGRDRSYSKERQYRDAARSDDRQNDYRRNYSRDRQERSDYRKDYQSRDRSQERRYNNNQDRSYSKERQYRDTARSEYRQNDRRSPSPYRRSFDSSNPYNRETSRERSENAQKALIQRQKLLRDYPNMHRGVNCAPNYNPAVVKKCTKCPNDIEHHEFQCHIYERYNRVRCSLCDKYNHYPSDCKELNKYPPKTSEVNSMLPN